MKTIQAVSLAMADFPTLLSPPKKRRYHKNEEKKKQNKKSRARRAEAKPDYEAAGYGHLLAMQSPPSTGGRLYSSTMQREVSVPLPDR